MINFEIDPDTFVITFTNGEGGSAIYTKNTYANRPFISVQDAKEFAEKTLSQGHVHFIKPLSLEEIKNQYIEISSSKAKLILDGRPIVDTGLGFSVDGGYRDLQNFEAGKALGFNTIKDSDGVKHTISSEDWDTIINAIRTKGIEIYQEKWAYEDAVNAANTVEEIKGIEKPFD